MQANTKDIKQISVFKTLLHAKSMSENPINFFQSNLDESDGIIECRLPYHFILTDRPEIIRQFFQKNHKNYIKTKIVRNDLGRAIGNGLLTSNGDYWLRQRRMIQQGFNKQRLKVISTIMVNEIETYLQQVMEPLAEQQLEIDCTDEMAALAFRIVGKSLFGQSVNEQQMQLMREVIRQVQEFVVDCLRKPYLKPWYFLSGYNRRVTKLIERGNEMILNIIRTRKANNQKEDDLLQMLIESKYEDGSSMSEQQILEESIILMVAGHETTAMTLSWTFMLLAQHPTIEQQLLASILQAIGGVQPSMTDLHKLDYSYQVLEESMRLYPPAWIVDREPLEDDTVEGYSVKKGVDVAAFIYGLHRNEKYWPEPDKFDPERFSVDNKKRHKPYTYLPFGGGPRICIGQHFAMMEMQYVLAMLLRRYRFQLTHEAAIELHPLVTLRAKNGIRMRVSKR